MRDARRAVERCAVGVALLAMGVAAAQKPNLQAGGPKPSEIENHKTTTVSLPGYHLADATLTVDGACSLVNYMAVENQIVMSLAANRSPRDHDGYCNLHVKTAAGKVSTWLIVGLTDEEQDQQTSTDRSVEREKAAQFVARSGSEWTLHFASGAQSTYKLKPDAEPGAPVFTDDAGNEAKIMVANDSTVLIVPSAGGCYRTGKLVGTRVTNGTSGGDCKPGGSWTAEMK